MAQHGKDGADHCAVNVAFLLLIEGIESVLENWKLIEEIPLVLRFCILTWSGYSNSFNSLKTSTAIPVTHLTWFNELASKPKWCYSSVSILFHVCRWNARLVLHLNDHPCTCLHDIHIETKVLPQKLIAFYTITKINNFNWFSDFVKFNYLPIA